MLEAIDGGGEAMAVTALRMNYETLTKFKKQVDDSLKALDESPASNGRVSRQTVSRTSYGDGFSAAQELAEAYEQAHENLKDLSQQLSNQLEALSLAIDISHKGASEMDEKHADRLRALRQQSQQDWDRHHKTHTHRSRTDLGDATQAQA